MHATGVRGERAHSTVMSTGGVEVLALFGPTSVGKTGVAVALARSLRSRGVSPVAVNCDAIQIYRGLETISGAASADERVELEHRLLGFVDPSEEMSAGTYAEAAHVEIDDLLRSGQFPIVVGGTGLWLKAALCDLDLKPQVDPDLRDRVERELEERGSAELHSELPERFSREAHPNDRNRVARWTALLRSGVEPQIDSTGMWEADFRHPTRMVGLIDEREEIGRRIDDRVERMAEEGAEEAQRLLEANPSRTAKAAIGLKGFAAGDLEDVKAQHRAYAKRQITWMRKMPGIELVDRAGASDEEIADRILETW